MFVTYFRVLKTVGHSPVLSPVLEGLAKFAHLINVDFFNDLMGALHTLLNNKVLYFTSQGKEAVCIIFLAHFLSRFCESMLLKN